MSSGVIGVILKATGAAKVHGYARSTMPTATPIAATEAELDAVTYDADGLVAAIVQEEGTGEVLMLAWMNEDALRRTLETGRTWFWSRSRQEYWCKGETSGDRQYVREALLRLRRRRAARSSWSRRAAAPATPASAAASSAPSASGATPGPV